MYLAKKEQNLGDESRESRKDVGMPLVSTAPELTVPLYCGARSTNSLMIGSPQDQDQASTSFPNRSSRVERADFPRSVQQFIELAYTCSGPSVERVSEHITV